MELEDVGRCSLLRSVRAENESKRSLWLSRGWKAGGLCRQRAEQFQRPGQNRAALKLCKRGQGLRSDSG